MNWLQFLHQKRFVVDTESSSEHSGTSSGSETEDEDENDDVNDSSESDPEIPLLLEEIGSELSEDAYDYSSSEEDDKSK